jgi:hypothetical protein
MVCRNKIFLKQIEPFSVIEGGFFRRRKWKVGSQETEVGSKKRS